MTSRNAGAAHRDDLPRGCAAECLAPESAELLRGKKSAVGAEIAGERMIARAGDVTRHRIERFVAPRETIGGARIDEHDFAALEAARNLFGGCNPRRLRLFATAAAVFFFGKTVPCFYLFEIAPVICAERLQKQRNNSGITAKKQRQYQRNNSGRM